MTMFLTCGCTYYPDRLVSESIFVRVEFIVEQQQETAVQPIKFVAQEQTKSP